MAYKNKENEKKHQREYFRTEKGKENHRKSREKFKNKIRQYIKDYKLFKGCSICGYKKCVSALDFHHNGDKDFIISQGQRMNCSLARMKAEIEKCIVLCRNCHAELHEKELIKEAQCQTTL